MECQTSDSKKILKVFDASKRKRVKKKREVLDDTNSLGTDDSRSLIQPDGNCKSAKASLQDLSIAQKDGSSPEGRTPKRDSSPAASRSPGAHRGQRSPRRHRRPHRDDISLALHAGLVSTPRSTSPTQEGDGMPDTVPLDQDSCIYAFLEEALKMDKKKQKHRRNDEHRDSHKRDHGRERDRDRDRDRDRARDRVCDHSASSVREHRHHHRRRREDIPSRDHEKPAKAQTQKQAIDQAVLLETFAKLCTTINEKSLPVAPCAISQVTRSQSHKSLQCEVARRDTFEDDQRPVRLRSREPSHDHMAPGYARVRSHENLHNSRSRLRSPVRGDRRYTPDKLPKYASKIDVVPSRTRVVDDDRYREFPLYPTKSSVDHERRDYYERRYPRRCYEEDKRRCCEQKTSRSFDVHREPYEDERIRRSTRSDSHNKKRYDELRDKRSDERDPRERRYDERRDRYYEDRERDRHVSNLPSKECRSRRNLERLERLSMASRDEEYARDRDRDRDRYSERERDSGMSVADGETSTVSGRSNYLKVVKQGIAEQRDAMERMMKLWKELMRCFKTLAPTQQSNENKVNDSAAHMQESAEAQLRLWRECMRRYETVARDVGDTDARLMDEISKQRSEMAEMASMWQECLQRYRDMSNDFNSLKRQIVTESPTRMPAQPQPTPPVCAEGEGSVQPAPYRLPPAYPPPPAMPPMAAYPGGGSPLRTRASAPPWWWMQEPPHPPPPAPRRHSSPESRDSRSHDRRHHRDRHKDRDESRYNKEKSSTKPGAARSEHRRRKR